MQFKEYKELLSIDDKGLTKEEEAAKKYLRGIQFENSQGNLKDSSQIKKTKVYVARINTIKNARLHEAKKA